MFSPRRNIPAQIRSTIPTTHEALASLLDKDARASFTFFRRGTLQQACCKGTPFPLEQAEDRNHLWNILIFFKQLTIFVIACRIFFP